MNSKNLLAKTSGMLMVMLVTLTFFSACKKEEGTLSAAASLDYQTIAWNYLDANQKSTVTINWRDAAIKEVTYEGKKAMSVTFPTAQDNTLGPIVIYISVETQMVLGAKLRA